MRPVKKLVLAYPNLRWHKSDFTLWISQPYNLCLLAACVRDLCDVAIVDANIRDLTPEQFQEEIRRHAPDVVGLSVMTSEYGAAGHAALALVKALDPAIVTVLGGVYATSNHARIAEDPNVDFVVIGEGERRLRALLEHLATGSPLPDGLAFRAEGQVRVLPPGGFIQDLDGLPLPAYDLVDFGMYGSHDLGRPSVDRPRRLPFARVVTSRGCPMGCCFCQVENIMGRAFRPRSPDSVLGELEWLVAAYGIRFILFDDDNLILDRQRALGIFRGMAERGLDLPWNATAMSTALLTEELLEAMVASGCQYLDLAVESGVQRVLDEIIRKPLKLDHAVRIIERAKALGIDTVANFVIGFPGETWDEIRRTLAFAEELDVDYVKIYFANPLPGTRLEGMAREGGFLVGDPSKVDWRYGKIRTPEFTPQDLAILRAYEWDRINFARQEKRAKTARMMGISEEALFQLRQETLRALDFSSVACP